MFGSELKIFFQFVDDSLVICVDVEMVKCQFEIGDVGFYFYVENFVCNKCVEEEQLFGEREY